MTLAKLLLSHPIWLAIEIMGLGLLAYLCVMGFLDWWAEREEARQDAERRRLDRVMSACGESKPRAAGYPSRRVG